MNLYYKLFSPFINWSKLSRKKLSEEFIREFQDKMNWTYISIYQKLSEDFIKEFKDKIDWYYISVYQKLSENFIREFQNKIDWVNISICQSLSKNFIREFQDKVAWRLIFNQKLSKDFIKLHQKFLDLEN